MVLDESSKKVLADLKRRRGVVKGSLTRMNNYVVKFDSVTDDIALLEFRQEELPQINRKFDDIQSQIELLEDDYEAEADERNKFEVDYFEVRAKIQSIINTKKALESSLQNQSTSSVKTSSRIKYAPVTIPGFDGNIQEWESFFNTFCSMVHNNNEFTTTEKFFHLRACVKGDALDLVKSVALTEANYDVALQRLKDRYENKARTIQSHIRSILNAPKIQQVSAKELQSLTSHVGAHVAALRALGQPTDQWDAWLVTIVVGRLDMSTGQEWQLRQNTRELPKYRELEEFLSSRCAAFETSEEFLDCTNVNSNMKMKKCNAAKSSLVVSEQKESVCICCKGPHRVWQCDSFKGMTVNERLTSVRNARACFNCFSTYHLVNLCKSKNVCTKCQMRHNSMLHIEKQKQPGTTTRKDDTSFESQDSLALCAAGRSSHVFLATAIVIVTDLSGTKRECRAILDSGSQINFVSKKIASQLKLSRNRANVAISGVGASHVRSTTCVTLNVGSRVKDFNMQLSCHVLPSIVESLSPCPDAVPEWHIPQEFLHQLADPSFRTSGSIDLLIGGGAFFDLLEIKRVQLGVGSLCLQESKLGWIVTGEIGPLCLVNVHSIGESLENEWATLEESKSNNYGRLSKANKRCMEEQEAVDHFQRTARRDENGRFVLRLPIKSELCHIGRTLDMATSRFMSVERRLQKDVSLREAYISFMQEYESAGHMQQVTEENLANTSFYLPHHPVLKASSLTTKLRVVFDASAKSSTGVSLNDVLMCGPTVQEDLFSILTRFRMHQYVITADVEKMFRQILVDPEDHSLQCILWREKPSDQLKKYKLSTVTYGTTSASFMATQCLVSLAEGEKQEYPRAAAAIQRDFYMDDLITGAETIEDCILLQTQIDSILQSAKLQLRKWCSNSQQIIACVDKDAREPLFVIRTESEDIIKSLGLCWKPVQDEFIFQVAPIAKRTRVTKRMLLSDLNKIFDPLGFLTPVLIAGKIFLQQLWQLKIEWDKPLSIDIQEKWETFHQHLEKLRPISIPRKCKPHISEQIELHGFCDASMEAFGACIYVRVINKDLPGQVISQLLCSRSRVAPLRGSTIPRLELSGALVLAQLASKVAMAWNFELKDFYFWTDSIIVLGWLNSQFSRLKTFVSNRVEQILEITDVRQWRHVKTNENPADLVSRGIDPCELESCKMWWRGPAWLSLGKESWDITFNPEQVSLDLPEQRPTKLALLVVNPLKDIVERYSSWQRLLRGVAWILRFIKYIASRRQRQSTRHLSVQNLRDAERTLLQRAQAEEFQAEIAALTKQKEISHRSKLKELNPLLRDNLLVVGGRLANADISEEQKRPIILPSNHKISRLIFIDRHQTLLHCGPQALLADIRRQYWPLRGRILARSVVKNCVICVRAKPSFRYPLMAPLPKERVICNRPFTNTGVDFAGPVTLRSGIRGRQNKKACVAMFICFVTKAVHIEAVEDLTSRSFIAALRRFSARRGKPETIWSDNGTNFVGARKELQVYTKSIEDQSAKEGINWKFSPPASPHFGGLWESSVKSAKHHLSRVMKQACLTLAELQTLLCQIEACLNSRPLTPMSSNANDLEPLTPAHFLIGAPITLPPEPNLVNESLAGLQRWKLVQGMLQNFWNRWRIEYLPQLQIRGKWRSVNKALEVDDIVIVKEENMPPARWKIARVTELHPGSDGNLRVVTIRVANGNETRRAVVKLCRLPIEGVDDTLVENK